MKITYKGDYALKALFQLALIYKDKGQADVLSIPEIAGLGDMPEKFLEQILLALRKGGFVKSRRGVQGGFSLARQPSDISMGEVIRFIEGPIEPISCVEKGQYKGCRDMANCIFRDIWREAGRAVSAIVDTVSFEELVLKYKEKNLDVSPQFDYAI